MIESLARVLKLANVNGRIEQLKKTGKYRRTNWPASKYTLDNAVGS